MNIRESKNQSQSKIQIESLQLTHIINMEKEQPDSDHQQSPPLGQNLEEDTTQTASQQIPQIVQLPFTPIQFNQPNQPQLLQYNMNVQDKQTSDALKLFKSIFYDKEQWNLSSKKWMKLQLQKVFQNLSKARPKKIDLTHSQMPLLLESLACLATFPCLKELRLCNNKISSFEKLTYIDFPVLEDLSLRDNDIVGIKCLNKMNFRAENIRKLSFYANRVRSLEPISRVNFVNANPKHKDTLKTLKKEENLYQEVQVQSEILMNHRYYENFQDEQRQNMSQKWKQEMDEEQGLVKEEVALRALSLLFGINQIGCMEEINKLQRRVIRPNEMKQKKMGDYWDYDSSSSSQKSFDPQNYKQTRRLILSMEMNKTIFKLNYNYFRRNYLPYDNIYA